MSIYSLRSLFESANETRAEINGKWVPARPVQGPIRDRIRAAWLVLVGKADAFTWPEGQ